MRISTPLALCTASSVRGGLVTITLTTLTATRMVGSFTAQLPARTGRTPTQISITGRSFDLTF